MVIIMDKKENKNNIKNKDIHVRISESDLNYIKQKAQSANLTVSQYFVDCAKNKNIVYVDGLNDFFVEYSYLLQLHSKYVYELNKIGVNINQIAYEVNRNEMISNDELVKLATYYSEIKAINNKLDMFIKGYTDIIGNIQNAIFDKIENG